MESGEEPGEEEDNATDKVCVCTVCVCVCVCVYVCMRASDMGYFSPCSTTPGKYGLQWQQPFLELVLACMKAQRTIHEELLAPLQKQLHNFLSAFEKVSQSTRLHHTAALSVG